MTYYGLCLVCGGETINNDCPSCMRRRMDDLETELERLRTIIVMAYRGDSGALYTEGESLDGNEPDT